LKISRIIPKSKSLIDFLTKNLFRRFLYENFNHFSVLSIHKASFGKTAEILASIPTVLLPYPYGLNMTPNSCPNSCSSSYSKTFSQDKVYGGKYYNWWFPSIDKIQQEIFSYGPVAAFFTGYEDFFYYKSGIYEYAYGNKVGYHLTKLIGWGTENGKDYWLAVNTWGTNWGQNGLFKIRRGNNTVGIEARISAVLPKEAL